MNNLQLEIPLLSAKNMSQTHYALVKKNECHPLATTTTTTTTTTRTSISSDKNKVLAKNTNAKDNVVRAELEEIYQTYADLYPNPKLTEEKRQRNNLLASTFQNEQEKDDTQLKKKPRRGFFTFLFGSRDEVKAEYTSTRKSTEDSGNDEDVNSRLTYRNTTNDQDDGSLCGTMKSLDVSCIPPEVYNVARSHLTSTKMRRENPNPLRWGPRSRLLTKQQMQYNNAKAESESESSNMFIVVGLGEIAEFGGSGTPVSDTRSTSDTHNGSSRILYTSDCDVLLEFAERTQQFDLSSVRGTILSQNCIAVSWGFLDGITVFYRRKMMTINNENLCSGSATGEGWEAIWWLGPSGPVLESITSDAQDMFHEFQEQLGTPSLKISDCVALHVEAPTKQLQEEDSMVVVTLVISRVGGYIELVPLPTELWKGPVLALNNYRKLREEPVDASRKRGWQRQQQHFHYTTGKNIASPSNTVALTTLDYHLDVQALEVFRTLVNSETIWNNEEYPLGPPAEFLLCASGLSVKGGFGETMTFWAVSTIFSRKESSTSKDSEDAIDFQVHSCLLEAIWTNTGSPVSIIASSGIMSKWRTPREVELKDVSVSKRNEGENSQNQTLTPVTTLSTTAPIVSMQFSSCDGSTSTPAGPFLSVLDWNGGVQIFDCSVLARVAAQNLTRKEYERYSNTENDQHQTQLPFHLVKSVVLRSEVAATLQELVTRPTVGNFHWLKCSIGEGEVGILPPIVFILNHARILVIATFDLSEDDYINGTRRPCKEGPHKTSVTPVIFPASGAVVGNLEGNILSFVSLLIKGPRSPAQTSTHFLKYFVMEQLQPVAIIETLARESKYREAIKSSKKLSKYEQNVLTDVVACCRRRLWEIDRDVDSLKATHDESYIIREVVLIYESDISDHRLNLEKLRSLLKYSLDIVLRGKLDKKIQKMRKYFVKLGTYELLCKYFKSETSLEKFWNEFKELDLNNLSLQLAQRGDVAALTIVVFRHRFEVHKKLLSILTALPLPLPSTSFCHLFPVLDEGDLSDFFLDSNQYISKFPWSHMPQYILETIQVSTVFGTYDEKVVLEYNKILNDILNDGMISEALVANWFMDRGRRAQTFIGNVGDVINLFEFGLQCSSPCLDETNLNEAIPNAQELHNTWRTSLSLQRMLLDQVVSINGDSINTDDIMGTNLVELLELLLSCRSRSSDILYRFREYVQPLVIEMHIPSSIDNLDEAMVAFCCKEVIKCRDFTTVEAKRALASAVIIAENSKASMHKRDRLIKQKKNLIRMVLNVTKEVSKNLGATVISMDDRKELVGTFWSLYETLPARLISLELQYELKLQALYQDLVGMDILSRWPECKQPFTFFNKRQTERNKTDNLFEEKNSDVLEICKSFINNVTAVSSQDEVALFWDLVCDIRSLNEVCFGSSLDISTIVCKHVIPVLLEKGYFGIVASYLGSDISDFNKEEIQHSVLEYVDEALFSESDDNSRIFEAIKCQDILELLLPSVKSVFRSNRRYLDASRFVATVLFDGKLVTPLKPIDFKEMNALDALETVLREVPESIGCGCLQWMDSVYARDANSLLREAESTAGVMLEENGLNELPDLPGGGIFHLATILGLESKTLALVVKCRVIHYALQIGFHGAAASIARTLIRDRGFGPNSDLSMGSTILGAIAEVVSNKNYLDQMTKKELCQTVLYRFKTKLSTTNSVAFSTILQVFSNLERIISRFNQDIDCFPSGRKDCLLSRPVARLYNHTFREYNTVIHCLFTDLANQTSQGLVNGSLMDALSRFVMYWCIHDSKSPKSVVYLRDKADFHDNLVSGCALILQIPSNFTGKNCVDELQKIALDQAINIDDKESFDTVNTFDVPDLNVVKKLTERGFGDNEARRAVIMTGNSGYNDALGWAALHTMDPDINGPLFVLKPSNKKYVDQGSVRLLQKILIELSNILKDPSYRSTFLHHISKLFEVVNRTFDPSHIMKADSKKEEKSSQPVAQKRIQQKKEQRITENISHASTNNHVDEGRDIIMADVQQQRRRPPPPPLRVSMAKSLLHQCSTRIRFESTAGTPSGEEIAGRDELRKKGQAALNKLRNTKSKPGSRRRLIQEGRLLLNQSKPRSSRRSQPNQNQALPQVEKTRRTAVSSEPTTRSFGSNTNPNGVNNKIIKIDHNDKSDGDDDNGWNFDDF